MYLVVQLGGHGSAHRQMSILWSEKLDGKYAQFRPNLTIMDVPVPSVEIDDSFKYLGKFFNFSTNDEPAKINLKTQLRELLDKTSSLDISPQMKLKILRLYIPSQISFDLRINNMSHTWIVQNLDSLVINAVNTWLDMPWNTCTKEVLELPRNSGGHDILLPSTMTMKLRLSLSQIQSATQREQGSQKNLPGNVFRRASH